MKINGYVLLGDVVGSRSIENRRVFDGKLEKAVKAVSTKYAADFRMPPSTWKGIDELAGILDNILSIYKIVDEFGDLILPERMRFVVARGSIEIPKNSGDIREADGDAFHEAAAMMLKAKAEKWMFRLKSGNEVHDMAVNTQINALLYIKSTWTENQRNIYRQYNELKTQEEVAKKTKISQQSISKSLQSIRAEQVLKLEDEFQKWLHATYRH
jgi:hypothetical protein